eukprot:scaffold226382_cov28-Tisochrysis_lutea.AAC.2
MGSSTPPPWARGVGGPMRQLARHCTLSEMSNNGNEDEDGEERDDGDDKNVNEAEVQKCQVWTA